ncbi:MAG: hypothetical protein KGO82_20955, partial [Bacteroidota bacterium]|nr:hypothetical protein [Bacteroidota bacterium]
ISRKKLETASGNYASHGPTNDDTTLASFQLSELEALIKSIKGSKEYKSLPKVKGKIDHSMIHLVCIRLVREKLESEKDLVVYEKYHYPTLKANAPKQKPGAGVKGSYSQLIPVLCGCIRIFHKSDEHSSFKEIADKKGNVLVLHPGGEGTGLIPPPKTAG